jgi:chromosome partitioning protein
MATVLSLINLKGGVGKTTVTLALADILAYEYKYKVLVIDLDPQTNVTVSLINQDEWQERDKTGKTLKQLFYDALHNTSEFNIKDAIVKNVSNVSGGIKGLDLLPSSLGLIEIQDQLAMVATASMFSQKPTEILKQAVADSLQEYDFVLVDCPPNLGTVTLNGIFISDYYLIPTIPDILSTYGIPQITKKVGVFANKENLRIRPMGIVLTKYRSGVQLHSTTAETLEQRAAADPRYPTIFETRIPFSVRAEEAADYNITPNTLKQKYGYSGLDSVFKRLVEEIHDNV